MKEKFHFPFSIFHLRLTIAGGGIEPMLNDSWAVSEAMANFKSQMTNGKSSSFPIS
jgi:hypothetical protein